MSKKGEDASWQEICRISRGADRLKIPVVHRDNHLHRQLLPDGLPRLREHKGLHRLEDADLFMMNTIAIMKWSAAQTGETGERKDILPIRAASESAEGRKAANARDAGWLWGFSL